MRILLDENVPAALAALLDGHSVKHVSDIGAQGLKNGELLALAESHFDAFVTLDRGILHQQNHRASVLTILVIRTVDGRVESVLSRANALLETLARVPVGTKAEVPATD